MLHFDHPDFETVASKEWIVTNGIGGYASSSLCGANTRRYHGLLVASFNPPAQRTVVVSRIEEKITHDGDDFFISSNQYPLAIHPNGYVWLASFERMPLPVSVFKSNKFTISKKVFMLHGSNTSVVEYTNQGIEKFNLTLTPLFVFRDYHQLFHEAEDFTFHTLEEDGQIKVFPKDELKPVIVGYSKGKFIAQDDWYRDFQYFREKERGLDYREDSRCVGHIELDLNPGEKVYVVLSVEENIPDGRPALWRSHEEMRIREIGNDISHSFIRDLMISGDQFCVWRISSAGYSLIAGYHWFTDWGRDTMIAMRGLVIATGQKKIAESIFRTFIKYLDEGMIPNRFPDDGQEPEYNTIDATLWLFISLYEYHQQFNDIEFIRQIFPSLTQVIAAHHQGTRYNIHVTPEGLLYGGDDHVQLTWMDAKVNDHVVTPRIGCAVEINALWYNALMVYIFFGEHLAEPVDDYQLKADQVKASFREYFMNLNGYLNDVVIPNQKLDDSIRPNQIYAVSLPFPLLNDAEGKSVLRIVHDHLYTDLGLRSLSPRDRDFKSIYTGDQWHRDHAYHQGTVWAYLWGEYAIAYLRLHDFSEKAKEDVLKMSASLQHHFYYEDGIHAISEIFDGGNPYEGKGCIQQAWSVGMTIKALSMCENQ